MKNALYVVFAGLMFACNSNNKTGNADKSSKLYGDSFDQKSAMNIDKALLQFTNEGKSENVVSGKISAVCQGEGCWYSIESGNTNQYVEFGEKFTIPKDCAGKSTTAKGYFYRDTTSIEELKSEAKESGKSQAEIDAIREPKIDISFRASGLVIK